MYSILIDISLMLCLKAQRKTSNSVFESPRAMAKLLKEAQRIKQVLSANSDHYAQVRHLV